MKKVITYGTFDLLHYGHINLLERAKKLGDHLIVAVSTDEFNWDEKQKKCYYSYEDRVHMLKAIKYVDEVIKEIADRHAITPAQVSLAWILSDKHRIAIPKTSNPEHLQGNLDAINVQLSADEIEKINKLARSDGRKIKHPDYSPEWDD